MTCTNAPLNITVVDPVVFAQWLSDRSIAAVLHVVVQVHNCGCACDSDPDLVGGGTQRVAAW